MNKFMNQDELRKQHIDSPATFEKMKQLGWCDQYGNQMFWFEDEYGRRVFRNMRSSRSSSALTNG